MLPVWSRTLEILTHKFSDQDIQNYAETRDKRLISLLFKKKELRDELSNWLKEVLKWNPENVKSSKNSEGLRNSGNAEFKVAQDRASLELYNKSVIIAPHKSAELSLALGNRSAVLFRLNFFEECVNDINFAMKNFNNLNLYPKLILRKVKALCKLNRISEASKCMEELKEFTWNNQNLNVEQKYQFTELYLNEFHNNRRLGGNEKGNDISNLSILPHLKKEHESFPFASNDLDLRVSPEGSNRGRKVIARKTIEVGDIIFVEKPFSYVILPEFSDSHCQFCCKPILAPVACSTCVECLYCSRKCEKRANNLFHRWECKGLNFIETLGVGHLAMRTMLTSAEKSSSHCEQLYYLETHLKDVPGRDFLQYGLTAVLLVTYLEEYTDYMNKRPIAMKEEVAFCILQNMTKAICNAFTIKKGNDDVALPKLLDLSLVSYATGMFPFAAMMNHSCLPNVVTSFYYNTLVVRTSARINEGEEVVNCYGPHAKRMKIAERKELLRNQFFFDCGCDSCVSGNDFADETDTFICKRCRNPLNFKMFPKISICSICKENIDQKTYESLIEKAEAWRKIAIELMSNENFEGALDIFKKSEEILRSILQKNHLVLLSNALHISDCYCATGTYDSGWKYLMEFMELSEEYFEAHSLEFAHLCIKTIDVFLISKNASGTNKKIINTLLEYFDKTTLAVEMNFGAWSKQYQLFLSKRRELTDLLNA